MVLCCTLNSSKSCKSVAEAMREEIPPGLWSQPPGSGYLATASHNWSTCHSACPACSLHSAPAQHRGSTCHQPRGVSRECRNATHTQVCGVPTKHCRQKTVAESCNGRIELLQKWRITRVSCGISAFPAMGPTISTKSHDTKGSSSHCCVLLTNRNQTGEKKITVLGWAAGKPRVNLLSFWSCNGFGQGNKSKFYQSSSCRSSLSWICVCICCSMSNPQQEAFTPPCVLLPPEHVGSSISVLDAETWLKCHQNVNRARKHSRVGI